MTGPEHYVEAERLVNLAQNSEMFSHPATEMAQVHAPLSLAAATALGREGEGRTQPSKDRAAWFDVAAECRKATS